MADGKDGEMPIVVLSRFDRVEMAEIIKSVRRIMNGKEVLFMHPLGAAWKLTSAVEELDLVDDTLILASELPKNKNTVGS